MSAVIRALTIDGQMDFCAPDGALSVPGAWNDMTRLAGLYRRLERRISSHHVTLDLHQVIDIAHPAWWVDSSGKNPPPMTLITANQVESGIWKTSNLRVGERSLDYVRKLEAKGKKLLFVWPVHCVIGSPGSNVHPDLLASLVEWSTRTGCVLDFVSKGTNPFTEHYSAIQAEIPDPDDSSTQLNTRLIDKLRDSDMVLVAGQALSHCVADTVNDIADNIGQEHIKKFVLLEDCTSSIAAVPNGPDFPAIANEFVSRMRARGMKVSNSRDFLADIQV